jgi:hypothetical protein
MRHGNDKSRAPKFIFRLFGASMGYESLTAFLDPLGVILIKLYRWGDEVTCKHWV